MGNLWSALVSYPTSEYVQEIIQQELDRHQELPEWQIKANAENELIDRQNHSRREKEIYQAETNIHGMFFSRCTKENRNNVSKCQKLFDVFTERKAYQLSNYHPDKEPKLSPPLRIDFSKMPYKADDEVLGDMKETSETWSWTSKDKDTAFAA